MILFFSLCYVSDSVCFCFFFLSLFISVGSCEMFLSFGIIQSINSHTARYKGVTNVGVWLSLGLNGGHMLSLSFFLCPDPVSPLFSCFI